MASSEKKSAAADLVNLCHLLMKELSMPEVALEELLRRASTSTELENFQSVRFWKFLIEPFQGLGEKVAMGPSQPATELGKRARSLDLNQPAPENEEPLELDLELKLFSGKAFGVIEEDDAAAVETEGSTTAGKGQMVKRMRFAQGPAVNEKGKGVLEMEGSGSN